MYSHINGTNRSEQFLIEAIKSPSIVNVTRNTSLGIAHYCLFI